MELKKNIAAIVSVKSYRKMLKISRLNKKSVSKWVSELIDKEIERIENENTENK